MELQGAGLVLDLVDPFKFTDREKLLQAIQVSYELNSRDFTAPPIGAVQDSTIQNGELFLSWKESGSRRTECQ